MGINKINIAISKLGPADIESFIEVIRLFEDVFEREGFSIPNSNHLQELLGKKDFFVFAAFLENKVVGGITAYVLEQYYSEKPLAYIYDLAVETKYQRQGIGRQLIAELTRYCNMHGFEEVFVQAEKVDEHAIDFYRSTAPTGEEHAVQFTYGLH